MPETLGPKGNPLVLIVDDIPMMLLLMREALEQAGFAVAEARDGVTALSMFSAHRPDIVLLDILMPDMNGFEVCQELRHLPGGEHVPILLVTGLEDTESLDRAYAAGATDFITKPIDWDVLSYRLRHVLRTSHTNEELYRKKEALRTSHAELEAHVSERTAALRRSHEQLQNEIAERQRAEASFRESENRYRLLLEHVCDLICELDENGRYQYVTPNHNFILGYAESELIGQYAHEFIHPRDRAAAVAVFQSGKGRQSFRFRHKNGSWRWLESSVQPYIAQRQYRTVVVSRDITDRRKAEGELALRDRAISSTSEGICITDPHQPDNPLIYINPGFERLTGYSEEEVLGKNCRFLQGPQTDQRELEKLRAAIQEEQACVVELLNYRRDGTPFWNRFAITPVLDNEGSVTHFIGVQSDITERKEMERLKDELVSTVSHELRTPLTSLRGFAELLLKRSFPQEKQREFLRVILGESLRLTELINDFLDLQRIESGQQTYDFEASALLPLLCDVTALFNLEGGKHSLRLDVPETLPLVYMDTARIQQVLTNLLSNAIKFSPQGGNLTIGVTLEGDVVKIWVMDQGIGIPPESLPNLFRKFYRVSNADTRTIGGTGLGLALVKEIIKAHQGRIWVESTVGVGSTFFFTLPLADAYTEAHGPSAPIPQDTPARPLIMDQVTS